MLIIENTVLIVIDMQINLYRVMQEQEAILENNCKIIRGVRTFGIPVIVTEQVPEKIGPTLSELAEHLQGIRAISKESFSCWKNQDFMKAVMAQDRKQLIVTGIETHVCVYQTVMDLLKVGYEVYVVADAVSSRSSANKIYGIERMRNAGAAIISTEMVLFELLQTAAHEKAKEIFKIVK
jgi:nicotinamidase-related amidase